MRIEYKTQAQFIEHFERQDPTTGEWERLVTGSVGDPQNVDCWDNHTPAEELRSAMIKFMEHYRNMGVDHVRDSAGNPITWNDKIVIIENWITRVDQEINGTSVPAGAWMMTVKVLDDDLWDSIVRGEKTGFSFMALAKRVPIAA